MERGGNGVEGTRSARTGTKDGPDLGRRECLKLVGTAAVSATGVAVESDVVRAASVGYGQGGHGENSYGGDGFGVSTLDATSVDTTSTTLEGKLSDLDGADSADCRFEWRQSGASSWNATAGQTLASTGSYTRSLNGLSDGSEYEYRAVATSSNGDTATGGTVTFTTTEDPPAVTTGVPSSVTGSGATLDGSLTDLGNAESVGCRFEWRQSGASSWNATATQTRSTTGAFSADVSGLSGGSDYEYRAVAEGSDGDTATGSTVGFTTTEDSSTGTTDTGDTAPEIDSYSVTEAGSPNPHAEITARWSVSDPDGDLDTAVVDVVDSSGSAVDSATVSVSGSGASGTEKFKVKHARNETFDVTVTVTDARDNSHSRTRTVTE